MIRTPFDRVMAVIIGALALTVVLAMVKCVGAPYEWLHVAAPLTVLPAGVVVALMAGGRR